SISFFLFRNGKLIEENEKYMLKGSNTELTVRNIINSDGGPYVCKATNKAGEDEKQAFLQVFVSPGPLPTGSPSSQWMSPGCDSPDGRIEVKGQHGSSSLHIKDVKLSDSGRYDCEAASRIGGHQKSMYLDIEYYIAKIAPTSDNDFGRYNCTATNRIGTRFQEYILALAAMVVLSNLEPNTTYEIRVAAVNGKGQGDYSKIEIFQTLPVRKSTFLFLLSHTSSPNYHEAVCIRMMNYSLVMLFAFRTKDKEDQWLEKKVQGNKDHIILEHLQWTMGYEVQITAANRLGYSEPTVYEFSMPPKPNIIK
ncbi:PREDICTED: neural cell adhesion molecule 2-like, partial [Propithecus coquereli]|uniref:neural cell adhesion molecule 2-like n=1 Tax=Propithecus coquereli TaxID=379532 RepID=UPI00063EFD9E